MSPVTTSSATRWSSARLEPTIGSLCTGYGGLDLGVRAALDGGRVAWVADSDLHISKVLATRLPGVTNLGDITAVEWDLVEPVDVITAGFPCQDVSSAGRGCGIRKGTRSGVWRQVVAAVRRLQPTLLVVENVAGLRWRTGGLGVVLGDLAEIGYDAYWASFRASDIGAPHLRERVFLLGYRTGTHFGAQGVRDTSSCGFAGGTIVRSGEVPAHSHQQQSQRSRGSGTVAWTPNSSASAWRERKWDGDAAFDRDAPAQDASRGRPSHYVTVGHAQASVAWAGYEPAIRRWEAVRRVAAPCPTEPGRYGRPRLAAAFVEWLMGLEPGWVTDVPIPRSAKIRALGNGVVPQQAEFAICTMLANLAEFDAACPSVADTGQVTR